MHDHAEEPLNSCHWVLSLLPRYSRLSKWVLPGLKGRARREIAEGDVCQW